MVIGIVVNVMEEEHASARAASQPDEPTNAELKAELQELKSMLNALQKNTP